MTTLISFPFRLTPVGSVAVRDDGDEEYLAEELAQLIQTVPGERELVPTFGLNDPAYSGFDKGMLIAQVGIFGPPVVIEDVTIAVVSDTERDVIVKFSPDLAVNEEAAIGEDIGSTDDTFDNYEEYSD